MAKKLTFKPAAAAAEGSEHRTHEHLGGRKVTLDEAIRTASRHAQGRKPAFEGETQRLNAFLPPELLRRIKMRASAEGKTISAFIADWARTLDAPHVDAGPQAATPPSGEGHSAQA